MPQGEEVRTKIPHTRTESCLTHTCFFPKPLLTEVNKSEFKKKRFGHIRKIYYIKSTGGIKAK